MDNYNYLPLSNNILSYNDLGNIRPYEEQPANIFSPINSNININILKLNNNETNIFFDNNIELIQNTATNILHKSNSNPDLMNKKTLVLDLDETLVHSSMKPFPNRDNIVLKLTITDKDYTIYVIKRPFIDEFLYEMSLYYEIVIFTASLIEYTTQLIPIIDKNKVIKQVLNREFCAYSRGLYFKELKVINKNIKDLIIVDNNPISYVFNKDNGIPILTWIDNPNDNELIKLIPILKYLSRVNDVRPIINQITDKNSGQLDYNIISSILNKVNLNDNQMDDVTKYNIRRSINMKINNEDINKNFDKIINNKENYNTINETYRNNNYINNNIYLNDNENNNISENIYINNNNIKIPDHLNNTMSNVSNNLNLLGNNQISRNFNNYIYLDNDTNKINNYIYLNNGIIDLKTLDNNNQINNNTNTYINSNNLNIPQNSDINETYNQQQIYENINNNLNNNENMDTIQNNKINLNINNDLNKNQISTLQNNKKVYKVVKISKIQNKNNKVVKIRGSSKTKKKNNVIKIIDNPNKSNNIKNNNNLKTVKVNKINDNNYIYMKKNIN